MCIVVLWVTWYSYNLKYDALNNELTTVQNNMQTKVNELNEANKLIEDLKDSYYELVYIGEFKLTHYCNEQFEHICGYGDGLTATGTHTTVGRTIAVDPTVIPYGTEVYIEGYGWRIAEDCGGAVKNKQIDILVNTHDQAMFTGVKHGGVWIVVKKS